MDIEDYIPDSEKVRNSEVLYNTHQTVRYFIDNQISPGPEWFTQEYKHILKYTTIDWDQIWHDYKWRDPYLSDIIYDIKLGLIEIIDEYSCNDHFSLQVYFNTLDRIISAWEHYNKLYGAAVDDELSGLLESFQL